MRAARFILVIATVVLVAGLLAPARWFTPSPASAQPPEIPFWVPVVIFALLLVPLFVPRLRPRLGWRSGVGVVWSRSGRRAYKMSSRGPRMSFLTWYGLVIMLAGMLLVMASAQEWGQKIPPTLGLKTMLIGVVLFFIGVIFTGGRGAVTKTTWLDTGKTTRKRGYYEGE